MAGVTLAYRMGYFRQILDPAGNQSESPVPWDPRDRLLEMMDGSASVIIEGRHVRVRAWRYWIKGIAIHVVPVYLLAPIARKTANGTARSLAPCMEATHIIASARRLCSESGASMESRA